MDKTNNLSTIFDGKDEIHINAKHYKYFQLSWHDQKKKEREIKKRWKDTIKNFTENDYPHETQPLSYIVDILKEDKEFVTITFNSWVYARCKQFRGKNKSKVNFPTRALWTAEGTNKDTYYKVIMKQDEVTKAKIEKNMNVEQKKDDNLNISNEKYIFPEDCDTQSQTTSLSQDVNDDNEITFLMKNLTWIKHKTELDQHWQTKIVC